MGKGADIGTLTDLTYWLGTGSDGIDAPDFQKSPAERHVLLRLPYPLTPELNRPLCHGQFVMWRAPRQWLRKATKS
ncbi:hypothetical protein TH1_04040 [Thalassospira lucentensis MCCC 1A00383 = DSM 14000]|nr:hypothetical protein TH1_04040 [Thalassospira lucentensis MCCC 1A00383 = DSM 14000]